MKKILTLVMISVIILAFGQVYAADDTIELEFEVIHNKEEEQFDLYLLLPQKYIEFVIDKAGFELNYNGANTIKKNTIPGITVKPENVQDEIYEENDIEYVQILLEEEQGSYLFDILEDYPNLYMKYRIKNDQKDYIIHIDNFEIKEGKCEIEYNYAKDTVKQPNQKVIPTGVKILIIILIAVVVVGGIAYIKKKRIEGFKTE